ncbi:MAG: MATE family efflux transporter [Clostridia bacterium]|nr:MATE family efflux transporter [Clostridia bacterium]
MVVFALPILIGNIFQQFYNTFDSWCVGYFIGDQALAAVSSSGSLIFMMIGFFNGVAMGAGVLIARYFGSKDIKAMRLAIHTDVAFGLCAGVLLSVLGVLLTPTILTLMDTPPDVLPLSIEYFRYYFCGTVFSVLYNIFVGILHAVGDSRHPLYYLIFASFVNVGLDLLFVGVLGFGVGSAALATTISQGISALLCFLKLLRVKEAYRLSVKEIRFHLPTFKKILSYGLPSGVQNSVIALANVVVQSNINGFGGEAMAGCGSYSKIEGFAFLPITCFMQALSTFVSQNLGAGKRDRVKKAIRFGLVTAVLLAEFVGVVSYLFAPQLIAIFNDKPAVVDFGVRHMRTICLFYCLLALSHCMAAILRGAGKAKVPMFSMLGCWCVFRVTYITVALQYVNRLETVSSAYPITWALSTVVLGIYILKGNWLSSFEKETKIGKEVTA